MKVKTSIKHLIITGLALSLTTGTTGCSVIAGIFGPEETITTDTGATVSRILVPTPTVQPDEAEPTEEPLPTATATDDSSGQFSPTTTSRVVTITGASVNLRSQPNTTAQILRTVPSGTTFEFVDKNSAGDWVQICCIDSQPAWVFAELAKVSEAAVVMPSESTTIAKETTDPRSAESVAASPTNALIINIPLDEAVFTQSTVAGGTQYEYTEQGFAITLPTQWQMIDLSAERLQQNLQALADANPQVAAMVETQVQLVVNARFNFYAVELTDDVLNRGFATTTHLLKLPLPADISLDFYAQLMAKQAEEKYGLTSPISLTPDSLPTGKSIILTYEISETTSGVNQTLAVTQYLIMQGQTIYALTFTTTPAQAESDTATFAAIAESFRILDN